MRTDEKPHFQSVTRHLQRAKCSASNWLQWGPTGKLAQLASGGVRANWHELNIECITTGIQMTTTQSIHPEQELPDSHVHTEINRDSVPRRSKWSFRTMNNEQ